MTNEKLQIFPIEGKMKGNKTWQLFQIRSIKKKTEGLIFAAQEHALATNTIKMKIHKTRKTGNIDYRLCKGNIDYAKEKIKLLTTLSATIAKSPRL